MAIALDYPNLRPVPSCPGLWASYIGDIYAETSLALKRLKTSKLRSGHLTIGYPKHLRQLQKRTQLVHRLALEAWEGPSKLVVDHIDCDPANNAVCNLQYVTREENSSLRGKRGRAPKNEAHSLCKLTNVEVLEIRSLQNKLSARKVATKYGVSHATVQNIWKRKLRKDL